ncbi:C10 family peptidase [Candidatus Cloacimonadota bacterium]
MIRKLMFLKLVVIVLIATLNYTLLAEQAEFVTCTQVAENKLIQLGRSGEFSIINVVQINDQQDEAAIFYVFQLDPEGYIVVSAETDLPPVIAYSFSSSFFDVGSGNVLLNMLKTDIQLRLNNVSILPDEIISARNGSWLQILDETDRNDRFEQWPPEGTTPTGGWLLDTWTQSAPYNNFCPMDMQSGNRSLAGCPSIAMAEILNYHRTTNRVSFDDEDDYYHNYGGNQYWIDNDHEEYDFLSFPELNDHLDVLAYNYLHELPVTYTDKAALVFACGVAAAQVYGSGGSGTFGVDQANDAYLKFNFEDVQLIYDTTPDFYEQIIQNIMDALPVHFATVTPAWDSGHNFVVDGYNTDDFYHINFGWGGSYNGWYLLPDEIPLGLTVVEGAIVDIVPDMYTGFITGQITLNPSVNDTSVVINLQNLTGDYTYEVAMDASGTTSYLFEVPIGMYSATASCPGYEIITYEEIMVEEDQFTYTNYYLYQLVPPADLTGDHSENEIFLNWQHPQSREFQYFNIYRNINSSAFTLLDTTSQLNYLDLINPQQSLTYGYYITAVYSQENESGASNQISVEVVGTATEDNIIQLHQISNYPNPFNPSTTISFSTTEITEDIELVIHNLKGQKIKSFDCHPVLVEERQSIIWDGTDLSGNLVSSGIYFARLKVGKETVVKKLMLLK